MAKPKILIIDDSPMIPAMLEKYIQIKDAVFIAAPDGASGKKAAKQEQPDIILLDIILPDTTGFEVCKAVKAEPWGKDIPVIFITSLEDDKTLMRCFEAGGVDYIHKPFRAVEVNVRIGTHLELARVHAEMKQNARIDFLTKVYNRAHMTESIKAESARAEREGSMFSLIIGDIDKFKAINDTYGHSAGDYALKTVAAIMLGTSRKSDIVARWGGEEFLILTPNTERDSALVYADNMRRRIAAFRYSYEGSEFQCTITFGVKIYDPAHSIDDNINAADEALYQGKMQGRNTVVLAQ